MQYDALASEYDEGRKHSKFRVYDEVTWHVARAAAPHPPARVLDAGAGTGAFAVRFLEAGYNVTLLEPSGQMLAKARERVARSGLEERASFVQGRIEGIGHLDGSFDFLFCEGDPLSYCLTGRDEAAREMMRVLRPGGSFYVSVDNRWLAALAFLGSGDAERAFAAVDEGRSVDPYGAPVHAFTPSELEALFARAGAADVRVTGKLVFVHLMPEAALGKILSSPADAGRLAALEARLASDRDLAGLASHLHVVGRRSA